MRETMGEPGIADINDRDVIKYMRPSTERSGLGSTRKTVGGLGVVRETKGETGVAGVKDNVDIKDVSPSTERSAIKIWVSSQKLSSSVETLVAIVPLKEWVKLCFWGDLLGRTGSTPIQLVVFPMGFAALESEGIAVLNAEGFVDYEDLTMEMDMGLVDGYGVEREQPLK